MKKKIFMVEYKNTTADEKMMESGTVYATKLPKILEYLKENISSRSVLWVEYHPFMKLPKGFICDFEKLSSFIEDSFYPKIYKNVLDQLDDEHFDDIQVKELINKSDYSNGLEKYDARTLIISRRDLL